MNLRIEGQQLRFRISEEELERVCSGSGLVQSTFFPGSRTLEVSVISQDIDAPLQVIPDGERITLAVQKQAAESLYRGLPDREGIRSRQAVHAAQVLELILEVDIRTQKRTRTTPAS